MADIILKSVFVPQVEIINKKIEGGNINLDLKRGFEKNTDGYIGTCDANLYLSEEKETEKTFLVHVKVSGQFESRKEIVDEEEMKDAVFKYLLPHLSAKMTTIMAAAEVQANLLPISIFAEFDK